MMCATVRASLAAPPSVLVASLAPDQNPVKASISRLPKWQRIRDWLAADGHAADPALSEWTSFAMSLRGYEHPLSAADKVWYYLGSCAAIWTTWQIGTLTGVLLGARIPGAWHLEFSIVLTFLAIVAPTIRDRAVAAAAVAAGVTAILAWPLPLRLGLIVAVAAGITAGLLAESLLPEKRP